MRRITPALIFGTIAASSVFTLFVGAQLKAGQCATIALPLNLQMNLGESCQVAR